MHCLAEEFTALPQKVTAVLAAAVRLTFAAALYFFLIAAARIPLSPRPLSPLAWERGETLIFKLPTPSA
jgi:hypothetical protein